jgi:hypothetical protein
MYHKGLSIVPKYNLVQNIGFSEQSTNTRKNPWDNIFFVHKAENIKFPLIHPSKIRLNVEFDKKYVRGDLKRLILKRVI